MARRVGCSGTVSEPTPFPVSVEEQCVVLHAAVRADAVLLHAPGSAEPRVRVGDASSGADAQTVELRTSADELLGTLSVLGGEGPVEELLASVARTVVALWELEAAQARLFDLEEALARADVELAHASGQLVHDLNNPLAAIAMCLEIAREQVEDDTLLAQLLDRADGSATKMKRMLVSLDDYGQRPVSGVTDLAVEVPALLADFAPLLDETVRVEGQLPSLALAPGDLRTVLVALWDNATKFRRDDVDLEVTVTAEPVGEAWRVRVRDNGRGIDPSETERVLQPTVRLDKRVPGLGLGLATVRRVVAAAGGRVGVESVPGEGTTVWFELPAGGPSAHR